MVAGLVVMRGVVYWWDFVRGGEASVIPPEAAVAEPLRRLFVLQFGVLAGALLVYWAFDSSVTGLAILLVAKTAADVVLAVLERLRAARITAAVEAGVRPGPRQAPRPARPPGRAQAAPLTDRRLAARGHAGRRLLPRPVRVEYDIALPRCDIVAEAAGTRSLIASLPGDVLRFDLQLEPVRPEPGGAIL